MKNTLRDLPEGTPPPDREVSLEWLGLALEDGHSANKTDTAERTEIDA